MNKQIWPKSMLSALDDLRKWGRLHIGEGKPGKPHYGVPKEIRYIKRRDGDQVDPVSIARPTINHLVIAGWAKYTDETRLIVEYVDKEQADRREKRLAEVGAALIRWTEEGSFTDSFGDIHISPSFHIKELVAWSRGKDQEGENGK